jgi:hypothetical protein
MPNPTELRDLIERLEKLGGEVDETRRAWLAQNLSCDIHAELLNPIPKGYHRISSSGRYLMASNRRGMSWSESVPDYIASLDAAVALVEKMLPGWVIAGLSNGTLDPKYRDVRLYTGWRASLGRIGAEITPETVGGQDFATGTAPTPAIALLLALLRALEQKP